jgi:hypothetical protein
MGGNSIFVTWSRKHLVTFSAGVGKGPLLAYKPITSEAGLSYHTIRLLACMMRSFKFPTPESQTRFSIDPRIQMVLLVLVNNSLSKVLSPPGIDISRSRGQTS